jgi:hypothetical protein
MMIIPTIWMTPVNDISTQDRLDYQSDLLALLTKLKMNPTYGGDNNVKVAKEELN